MQIKSVRTLFLANTLGFVLGSSRTERLARPMPDNREIIYVDFNVCTKDGKVQYSLINYYDSDKWYQVDIPKDTDQIFFKPMFTITDDTNRDEIMRDPLYRTPENFNRGYHYWIRGQSDKLGAFLEAERMGIDFVDSSDAQLPKTTVLVDLRVSESGTRVLNHYTEKGDLIRFNKANIPAKYYFQPAYFTDDNNTHILHMTPTGDEFHNQYKSYMRGLLDVYLKHSGCKSFLDVTLKPRRQHWRPTPLVHVKLPQPPSSSSSGESGHAGGEFAETLRKANRRLKHQGVQEENISRLASCDVFSSEVDQKEVSQADSSKSE